MPKNKTPLIATALARYVTDVAQAATYDDHYRFTELLRFDTEFLCGELTGGSVLDLGCGTGRHLTALARNGHPCTGVDLSWPMLEIARAKAAAAVGEIRDASAPLPRLLQANLRAPLPFQDGSFDNAICMFSTLGLIPSTAERLAFVKEVRRVIRPGGSFILHVHNRLYNIVAGWGRWWLFKTYTLDRIFTSLECGDKILDDYRGIPDMYLHVFSLGEVKRLLKEGGFDIRRTVCLDDDRTGEVTGAFASVRANGFILLAAKPSQQSA